MRPNLRRPTLQLARGEVLGLREPKSLTLDVCRGRVWVTHEGFGGDAFPGACERVEIPTGGLTVVEAIDDSVVRLRPEPDRRAQALTLFVGAVAGVLRGIAGRIEVTGKNRRAAC